MVRESDLDLLIEKMSGDHNKDTSFVENYSRVHTKRNCSPRMRTSTPEEQQQRNKEAWYAAGQHRQQQRSLTPILKRRNNDLSPISPTSDYSESQSSPRGRQMNSSNRTNVSGYESDNSLSPRFRSVSPYRQKSVQIGPVTELVPKEDYYRHKDARHNKPLPGYNQYMGSSPYLDDTVNTPPRRSPVPRWGSRSSSRNNSRSNSPSFYDQDGRQSPRFGGQDGRQSPRFSGQDGRQSPRFSSQDGRRSPRFLNQSSVSSNYDNDGLNRDGLEREDDEYPLRRSISKENIGPCDEIDRKGRFKNLPSNWEKSLQFFEEKREQLPIQHIKKVEPLNKYLKPQRVTLSESTPNLIQHLNEKAKLQDIPEWMKDIKHIVIEQVPVPIPPRFGTLLHGRRNADWALAPILDGPPCKLCHKPITESRCIRSDNNMFHCWHFVCSFCVKVLQQDDFTMASDNKPYCLNCFRRAFRS